MKKCHSRRHFIKNAACITGGIATFPYVIPNTVLGRSGDISPSNKITIGMIGVGSHGTNVNLKSFLNQEDAQVIAVCDVDGSRVERARNLVNQKYDNQYLG